MADYIFDAGEVLEQPTDQAFDGSWHTLGAEAEVSAPANMVGGRAWWPTSDPANFLWLIYRIADEQVMAWVDLVAAVPSPVNSAWNEFTDVAFTIPPGGSSTLDPAEQYAVAIATNGDFVYRNSSVSYPYGAGLIQATQSRFHNGGATAVFPDSHNIGDMFFADVLVAPASAPVVQGSASLTAQSSLASAGLVTVQAAATLTAQSALTAAALVTVQGAAALTAQTSLTAAALVTQQAAAALSAQSTLTAAARVTVQGAAALSAQSNMVVRAVDLIEPGLGTPDGTVLIPTPGGSVRVPVASGRP